MTLKIGDTLYRFDGNRRVYGSGMRGAPIYREHFQPLKIIGENKVSWILENNWKAKKKDLSSARAFQFGGRGFFTEEDMEADIWRKDHRYAIRDLLDKAPTDQLKQIAAILGYDPERKP